MNHRGFTVVEFLVTLAVGGMVLAGIVPAIFQMTVGLTRNNGEGIALSDIQNAAHWLTRDLQMAHTTDLIDLAPPVSQVTLSWNDLTEWAVNEGSVSHSATYTYSGTTLQRNYDGQVSIVARHLTYVGFSINGRLVTVTLTSSPEDLMPRSSETRTYLIYLRPGEEWY
jgi:prepilin-type N-terminal cleavage/methylation domain-containing protein